MQQLGAYVITLTAAALICGVLLSMFPEGTMRKLLKLVCGVFLTVTSLAPLTGFTLPEWEDCVAQYTDAGETAAFQGEEMAMEERLVLIKTGLDAYILDKAAALGCEITADVSLNQEGIPVSIFLMGDVPPDTQQALEMIITKDLGISKENQQWTGENGRN